MRHLSVLIPDVGTHFSTRVARCLAASRNVTLHGLTDKEATPLLYSSLFAKLDHWSQPRGIASWLRQVDEIVATRRIDVVLPTADFGIRTLSEHRHLLNCADRIVHLPDPHVYDLATNKASLAGFLSDHAIPHPPSVVVTVGEKPNGLSALTFPVLAKPPLLAGGHGIQRCESAAELNAFLASKSEGDTWVVQEFVDGTDLSVNVLCENGTIISSTIAHAIDQLPYRPPIGIEFIDNSLAIDIATRLMEKLRWSGVANIDMRLDTKRKAPVVLEVNGRYWITLLGSLNAGVNFPLLACETAAGLPLSNRRANSTRYFRGKRNAFISLLGGGRYGIKPRETDLKNIVRNLVRLASHAISTTTGFIRDKISPHY
jgi:predicted ATP-grasp superfamily ATP-dependent carboligase